MTDYIVGGIIAALLILTVIRVVRNARAGRCSGCSGCAQSQQAQSKAALTPDCCACGHEHTAEHK